MLHKEGGAFGSALPGSEECNMMRRRKEVAERVKETKQTQMIAAEEEMNVIQKYWINKIADYSYDLKVSFQTWSRRPRFR